MFTATSPAPKPKICTVTISLYLLFPLSITYDFFFTTQYRGNIIWDGRGTNTNDRLIFYEFYVADLGGNAYIWCVIFCLKKTIKVSCTAPHRNRHSACALQRNTLCISPVNRREYVSCECRKYKTSTGILLLLQTSLRTVFKNIYVESSKLSVSFIRKSIKYCRYYSEPTAPIQNTRRFEFWALIAVTLKRKVFQDATLCRWASSFRCVNIFHSDILPPVLQGRLIKIKNRYSTKFCSGKLKGEVIVEDTRVDGRMILKCIRYRMEGFRTYLCGPMTNFCEHAH